MVVFLCDGCGETLKKSQVDSHAGRCRRCDSVSCVDCSVSFYGDDYRGHTSCLTEAERYEKSVYKGGSKKKQNPQEVWMELIQSSVSDAPESIRSHLQVLATLDNVPRKAKPFRNFTANSLNLRGKRQVEEMWNYLSELKERGLAKKKAEEEKAAAAKIAAKSPEESEKPAKEKDTDQEGHSTDKMTAVVDSIDPKTLRKAVKKTLKKAPKRSMKIKSLQRAVREALGVDKQERKTFKKRISREVQSDTKRFRVEGKVVSLI